jgi:hypothetical protein
MDVALRAREYQRQALGGADRHDAMLLDPAHHVGFAAIVSVTDAHCSISLISVGTFASLWILRFGAKIMRT